MARPPAISMHRARGASVPSRHRRIRRPGRARRAAARRPGPRCPGARSAAPPLPLCPGPAPPCRPQPARTPRRARRPGAASSGPQRPPARPAMHVNLEKVAGAPARTSAAASGRPRPGALSFSSRTKVPRAAGRGRGDPVLRATLRRGPGAQYGEARVGRRGAARSAAPCGTGEAGPGRALRRRRPGGARPCEESRAKAPLGSRRFGAGGREALGVRTRGLCRGRRDSAALAALGRVPPARARPSTCAPRSPSRSRRLLRADRPSADEGHAKEVALEPEAAPACKNSTAVF